MKLVASFAALALAACLVGCQNNKTNDAAPGAVSNNSCAKSCDKAGCDKAACDKAAAAPGAVNGSCAKSCGDKAAAAPGAVNGSCSKSCGDKASAAPGAVSGSGCCKSKSSCTK